MSRSLSGVLVLISVLLVCAPLSIIVTLILVPLWRWVEAAVGIDSIGHSGPAEWCYFIVFALMSLGSLGVVWMVKRRRLKG